MKIKIPNFKDISKATKIIKIFLILIFIAIFVLPGLFFSYYIIYNLIIHYPPYISTNSKNKTSKTESIKNIKYPKPKISITPSIIPTPFLNRSEDYYVIRSYNLGEESNFEYGDEDKDKKNSYFYLEHRSRFSENINKSIAGSYVDAIYCLEENLNIYQENINISYSPVDLHQFIDKEVVVNGEFISFDYEKNQQCILNVCKKPKDYYGLNSTGYLLNINSISFKK